MNDVAAILLAAGRSERMGAFKPLLPFGMKTVVESCIDYLREGGVKTIVVVVGHRADELRERLKYADVLFATNPETNSEMNASIAWGVRQLPSLARATLIALADQPAIPARVVTELIDRWRKGARLLKPVFEGRGGHPILIDLSLRDELLTLDSQRGLKALFDAYQAEVFRLAVNSSYIAREMNKWDDYLALHEEIFGFSPEN